MGFQERRDLQRGEVVEVYLWEPNAQIVVDAVGVGRIIIITRDGSGPVGRDNSSSPPRVTLVHRVELFDESVSFVERAFELIRPTYDDDFKWQEIEIE